MGVTGDKRVNRPNLTRTRQLITAFETAVLDVAWAGSKPPEEAAEARRQHSIARLALEKHIIATIQSRVRQDRLNRKRSPANG